MRAGVTFHDPATTYLESDVEIGPDTEVGPNVQLLGRTTVGRACRFDGTALLRDTVLGDRVHVRLGVVMTECRVGDDVVIGPFAHLRPATDLAAGVHIGNFVETKNVHLGTGTKANHLTYLGDAEIGEHTNVGAGTITCNYDGFAKHRTAIGSRVQIGSDTQLVAPVTVGDDAYVGAGTTVTEDVPAGALVLSRVQQRTVRGWVARRRADKAQQKAPQAKLASTPSKSAPRAKTAHAKRKTTSRLRAPARGGRREKR
jgi:bifunctional UDP-N-acetylglucosamine pyrophosphorylase/glucosamine-1-phosphate N-acetyltransferase